MSYITNIGRSKIYIGNANDAVNKKFFIDNNISAVVNCTPDVPFLHTQLNGIRLILNDSGKKIDIDKMTNFLPKIVLWIDKMVRSGRNILVHCHAGIQRSATVVVAYLMSKYKTSLQNTLTFVNDRRPQTFSFGMQVNFIESLRDFEKHYL